jgi:ABC-2 type transport system permease protein
MLPGMVALSSMTICFGGTTFSLCGQRLFTKTLQEMLLLPVHPLALAIKTASMGLRERGVFAPVPVSLVCGAGAGKPWRWPSALPVLANLLACRTERRPATSHISHINRVKVCRCVLASAY